MHIGLLFADDITLQNRQRQHGNKNHPSTRTDQGVNILINLY